MALFILFFFIVSVLGSNISELETSIQEAEQTKDTLAMALDGISKEFKRMTKSWIVGLEANDWGLTSFSKLLVYCLLLRN